jgi:Arc/MetJ-type ribon-helix-helix transcriptional regulator
MRESGGRRADVSEVLGEAVSVWLAIRPAQRAIIRAVAERQDLTRPEVLRQALDAWLTSLDPRSA